MSVQSVASDITEARVSGRLRLVRRARRPYEDPRARPRPNLLARHVQLLSSRELTMRAVYEAGLNARIRALRSSSEDVRDSQTRLRLDRNGREAGELIVTHAASPELHEDVRRYRLLVVSESQYELWSGPQWLGLGTFGLAFAAERQRLRVARAMLDTPLTGNEYELEILPLHKVVTAALERVEVLAVSSSVRATTSDSLVGEIEVAFRDVSPTRARAFLRALALAYREPAAAEGILFTLSISRGKSAPLLVPLDDAEPPRKRESQPPLTEAERPTYVPPPGEDLEKLLLWDPHKRARRWGAAIGLSACAALIVHWSSSYAAERERLRARAAERTPTVSGAMAEPEDASPLLRPVVVPLEKVEPAELSDGADPTVPRASARTALHGPSKAARLAPVRPSALRNVFGPRDFEAPAEAIETPEMLPKPSPLPLNPY